MKEPGISDHCPLVATLKKVNQGRKTFKFFNFWMKHKLFKEILVNEWNKTEEGNLMYRVSSRLKKLKIPLRKLNKEFYSNITVRVQAAREELYAIQNSLRQNPKDVSVRRQEKEMVLEMKKVFINKNQGLNGCNREIRILDSFTKR